MISELKTECCIIGGGPAGMMLGFLLARAGIEVIVLEKHSDFFRDFRGDTIHPSTFNIMNELGLLEPFLHIQHHEQKEIKIAIGKKLYHIADFSHLTVAHRALGFMPQWDFLNFLLERSKNYPSFKLMFDAEGINVIEDKGRIVGVNAICKNRNTVIYSSLIVAADGRSSVIRKNAGLIPEELGAPMDVLWFKISKNNDDPALPLLHLNSNNIFVCIDRISYYQCGYIIKKGRFNELKTEGLDNFKNKVSFSLPFAKTRINELKSWDDIKLLTVSVNRLKKWYKEGFLCIGDAAHAMSPIGGVGINLAIQDAVAAANILYPAFLNNTLDISVLKKVQKKRQFATKLIQGMQVLIQDMTISSILQGGNRKIRVPIFIKLIQWFPILKRIPAWLIGTGVTMEHVGTPEKSVRL